MCLVIDMNTIPVIFNPQSEHHEKYKPVLDWIIHGKGKMVCGGTKYWDELQRIGKYIRFFNQLNKAGKVVKIDDGKVDEKMKELMILCTDPDFDDPHIAALLIVSGCKVICTEDERSYPYIRNKCWYPKGRNIPKIYKKTSFKIASKLLIDDNIAEICLPCLKLNKEQANILTPD
ncbi:hypothetical protein ACEUCT_07640 [Aeromonas caviae]|uniref:hypothetical protein n=1 Tax=Aeromonas caviae TaxID=648 RepID=UPI00244842F4|nr:hypothetical protein [Aeromonas caviae]MDH1840491.1 PIN domain-containing protein [Aeromonas caviae]